MALISGAWAFTFLRSGDPAGAVVLGLLLTVAVLVVRRQTVASGLAIAAVIAAGRFAFDVPGDNPWFLAGALVGLYAAGRHGAPPATLPVFVAFWAALVSLDPTMATALFAGFSSARRGRSAMCFAAGLPRPIVPASRRLRWLAWTRMPVRNGWSPRNVHGWRRTSSV